MAHPPFLVSGPLNPGWRRALETAFGPNDGVNANRLRWNLLLGLVSLLVSGPLLVGSPAFADFAYADEAPPVQNQPGNTSSDGPSKRPNIVWIMVDDMSAQFSCYGETTIRTPHVDRMAREGTKFTRAFVTAPVCSTCRSSLVTGMYQTSIGCENHRSGRGRLKIRLPEPVTPIPVLMKEAGYYTCIGNGYAGRGGLGKTDYNFTWDEALYDGPDWAGRAEGQPFFMQVQLAGGKLREGAKGATLAKTYGMTPTKPEDVLLPPYYPDDPVLRDDWARYLDTVRVTDGEVGHVLQRLDDEGLLDDTLVIFFTDHGISHARGKQFLYDEGTHIPLVMRGAGVPKATTRHDLVEHIDIAAVTLAAAGVDIPDWMQADDILAKDYLPKSEIYAARDRCDESVDIIRSVRTDQYLYIRNVLPARPLLMPNAYKDAKPILIRLREMRDQGTLPELSERLLFAERRAPEELYAWTVDGYQLVDRARDPALAEVLSDLRGRLDRWIETTGDQGINGEDPARFASDMDAYLGRGSARRPSYFDTVERNLEQMKAWADAGE